MTTLSTLVNRKLVRKNKVLDILAEQLLQAKVVQLEIPIDEEQLMELIRTELAQGSNVEGGQTNPHGERKIK